MGNSLFALVVYPIAVLFIIGCMFYRGYQEYKAAEEAKRKRKLEITPCLCGHARWIHKMGTGWGMCLDWNWDKPCPCTAYRMDNLLYLERLTVEDGYYTL